MKPITDEVQLSLPVEPQRGTVTLNGIPLQAVKAVSVFRREGEPTEVTITLLANVNYTPIE